MAISTIDVFITPSQVGQWILVATNPTSLLIKPSAFHKWQLAITAGGAPAGDLIGVEMGTDSNDRDEPFESGAVTGEVYIRIMTPPASSPASRFHFGIIRDQ